MIAEKIKNYRMKTGAVFLLLILLISACAGEEEYFFSEKEIERLLSGGEDKYWLISGRWENGTAIPLQNCDQYKLLRIGQRTSVRFYEVLLDSGHADCAKAVNELVRLDSGSWKLQATPSHNNTPDTLIFKKDIIETNKIITDLTSLFLTLEEIVPDSVVQNGDTVIVDKIITEKFTAHY